MLAVVLLNIKPQATSISRKLNSTLLADTTIFGGQTNTITATRIEQAPSAYGTSAFRGSPILE
jgi:hypothetical protein